MTVGEVHECLSQKRKAILKTGFSRFPTTSFSLHHRSLSNSQLHKPQSLLSLLVRSDRKFRMH